MPTFQYTVEVEADSEAQADQVMEERISFEEDYGFEYGICHWRS